MPRVMNEDDRYLKQSLSFLTAALMTIGVIFCLSFVKNELNLATIAANYNLNIHDFVAEKSEKYQYLFGTVSFPVFYCLSQLLFNKIHIKCRQKYENIVSWGGLTAIFVLALVILLNVPQILTAVINVPDHNMQYKNPVLYLVLSVSTLLASILFYGLLTLYSRLGNGNRKLVPTGFKVKKAFDIAIAVTAMGNLAFIFFVYITKTYCYNPGSTILPFDAYFYPVYKVFCGQTPLVDFNSLYGFYPYFLVPLLKLTGGITMLRFSVIMAVLAVISIGLLTAILFDFCENKFLALIGTFAISFTIAVLPVLTGPPYYLQYVPHRIIFPILILFLCYQTVKAKSAKSQKALTIAGYTAAAASLLWNLDTGSVSLLAFALFRVYLLLLKYGLKEKRLYAAIVKIMFCTVCCILAAFAILLLVTYARTGKRLEIMNIIYSQTSFYGLGFYMLRMPLWAPWLLLVTLYAVFLARALRKIKFLRTIPDEQAAAKSTLYFLLPVIGMGIFSYYQGRSHFSTFLAVIWPGILLLIVLADEYYNNIHKMTPVRKSVSYCNKLKFALVFVLLTCLAGNYVMHAAVPSEFTLQKDKTHAMKTTEVSAFLDVVKEARQGKEPIDLVAYNAETVYCLLGETRIANVPATIDWFTKEDYRRVFHYLSETKNKVIIDNASLYYLQTYEPENLNTVLKRFVLLQQLEGYRVYSLITK